MPGITRPLIRCMLVVAGALIVAGVRPARALTYGTAAVLVTVQDNDGPSLSLSLPKTSVSENAGSLTATLTRLHVPATASMGVTLSSSDRTRVTMPPTVTIPAGRASATFKVTILNNRVVDGNHTITLTASTVGLVPGTTTLQVLDDEPPPATIPRSTVVLSSAAGSGSGAIRLRFTGALDAGFAQDATRYSVTVNGLAAAVESLAYDAITHTVTLTLPQGTTGEAGVSWQDLRDTQNRAVAGSAGPLIVR